MTIWANFHDFSSFLPQTVRFFTVLRQIKQYWIRCWIENNYEISFRSSSTIFSSENWLRYRDFVNTLVFCVRRNLYDWMSFVGNIFLKICGFTPFRTAQNDPWYSNSAHLPTWPLDWLVFVENTSLYQCHQELYTYIHLNIFFVEYPIVLGEL